MSKIKAEIISTGTELLLGVIVNSNARYLSEKLSTLGIDVYFHTVVGDNEERMSQAIKTALERADLIITTGGLGPTQDDLTKETVAKVLGLEMQPDAKSLAEIEKFFISRGKPMVEINKKQALFPVGARILPNDLGTAPGAVIENAGKTIIILPGPPKELAPMFDNYARALLREKAGPAAIIKSKTLRIFGIGESSAQEKLEDIFRNQTNPSLAFNAKSAEIHIRITAKAADDAEADRLIAGTENMIRERIGQHIFGVDDESLEYAVGKLLRDNKFTIAVAESCTGGMIAARLTEVPGSSDYFMYGVVSYSNQAKEQLLGVQGTTLARYGAVSEQTALEMARGVRAIKETDFGLSVTGIAGPGGGTPEKPVGLVYVGLSTPEANFAKAFNFAGDRQLVRLLTSTAALNMVRRYITDKKID